MNFLDQPLSFTRTSRISRTPAQYAASIECPTRVGSPVMGAVVFAAILAAVVIVAATR